MKADAVFQGGGVKAIGFVGAVCRMEKEGFEWVQLAGTSAGAIVASLLAVGYNGIEMKKIISGFDYLKLLHKDTIQSAPFLGKPLGILFEKGFYKTDKIESWLNDLFIVKGKTKFKHLYRNNKSRLRVIASDVTNKNMIIFPDDLIDYGLNPYEFDIARAVCMSISIPIYFTPKILETKSKEQKSYIVDGGVFSNFPIWIFDVEGIPRWPTFGFKFDNPEINIKMKQNSFTYFKDLYESLIDTTDEKYLNNKDSVRTITIPTQNIRPTQFNINDLQSQKLFLSGYNSTDVFLKTWDFKRYIEKYRKANESLSNSSLRIFKT